MTVIGVIDPGLMTGATIGYFDDTTPFTLWKRWQIGGGEAGFAKWIEEDHFQNVDILICEEFVLAKQDFVANCLPMTLEGTLKAAQRWTDHIPDTPIIWYSNRKKSALTGYPPEADTKARRKRVRYNFLKRFDLYKAGTQFDDSNDCCVYSVIHLKLMGHRPTLDYYFPQRESAA